MTRMSVIPAKFDLTAFDEMFRFENARLQRWTSRPALVVVASTMALSSTSAEAFQASAEQMTEDEVSQMVAHMTEGLSMLTGNNYTSFQSVEIERPAAGDRVTVTRAGKIVVGRYTGVVTLANTIGYGRWSTLSDGTVVGGAMYLDRDFDKNDSRRRLLRIHELGHALGYQHVRSRTSIMNPAIGPIRPTSIAPARSSPSSVSRGTGRPMWTRPAASGCRAPPKAGVGPSRPCAGRCRNRDQRRLASHRLTNTMRPRHRDGPVEHRQHSHGSGRPDVAACEHREPESRERIVVHEVGPRGRRSWQADRRQIDRRIDQPQPREPLGRLFAHVGHQGPEPVDNLPVEFHHRLAPAVALKVDALPHIFDEGEVIGPTVIEHANEIACSACRTASAPAASASIA